MVKMIVSDLDGTLLRNDKTISDKTIETLKHCREANIKVVYATGRGGSAERAAPARHFDGRIVMNGAVAHVGDSVVYNCLIPYKIARPLLIACDRQGIKTASEVSGMHYSNFATSDEWPNITNYKITDFSKHDIDAEKLYMIVKNIDDQKFIEKNLPNGLYLTVSRDGLAQVMHKDATKSKAIIALAHFWGIDQSEIVAFGDDLNDLDMLSHAGIGVAMGNAVDELKVIADYICLSNEEDGVAEWIIKKEILK